MRLIEARRLDSFNVTSHTRICSVHFEGGLSPTKLNLFPSIFVFPPHLQRKPSPKSRTDLEERDRKQRNETPQTSKNKKVFNPRKKKETRC